MMSIGGTRILGSSRVHMHLFQILRQLQCMKYKDIYKYFFSERRLQPAVNTVTSKLFYCYKKYLGFIATLQTFIMLYNVFCIGHANPTNTLTILTHFLLLAMPVYYTSVNIMMRFVSFLKRSIIDLYKYEIDMYCFFFQRDISGNADGSSPVEAVHIHQRCSSMYFGFPFMPVILFLKHQTHFRWHLSNCIRL